MKHKSKTSQKEKQAYGQEIVEYVLNAFEDSSLVPYVYNMPAATYVLTPFFWSSATRFWMHKLVDKDKNHISYNIIDVSEKMNAETIRLIFDMCGAEHAARQDSLADQAKQHAF